MSRTPAHSSSSGVTACWRSRRWGPCASTGPSGTFLVAADFVALDGAASRDRTGRGRPRRGRVRPRRGERVVQDTWDAHDAPVLDGGVYWQTTGPRFETPAEIRVLATFADVVGMTVGSECVAARPGRARLRAGLHRRQPRQRARGGAAHDRGVRRGHGGEPGTGSSTPSTASSRSSASSMGRSACERGWRPARARERGSVDGGAPSGSVGLRRSTASSRTWDPTSSRRRVTRSSTVPGSRSFPASSTATGTRR